MSLPIPSLEALRSISNDYGLRSSDEDLLVYIESTIHELEQLKAVDDWSNPLVHEASHSYKGRKSHKAKDEENPLNAWYQITNISNPHATSNLLSGYKVGVKDNISIAHVPMMAGSRILEGYVPDLDATVVKRILDHGGIISGNTTCENLCLSGSSFNTVYGPVRNPWNPDYSAGGSSSGSGVVVATGEADVALGADQGGSIRIPSSSCGIVGLKPTHGLVPYTGCIAMEQTLDHVGPMARTVSDCARLLTAVAGFDDRKDPRQPSCGFHAPNFVQQVASAKPHSLRIGILKEGFNECKENVIEAVQHAIGLIKSSNQFLKVAEVSIPEHDKAMLAYGPVVFFGFMNSFVDGAGVGTGTGGIHSPALYQKLHEGFQTHAHTLHPLAKSSMLSGAYVKKHGGHKMFTSYAKGQTWGWVLAKEYDKALSEYDVLIMPTLPCIPARILGEDAPIKENLESTANMIRNTAPFDLTHHPALSMNAGYDSETGLPIGMQLVGRLWDDATVLKAAKLIEDIIAPLQKPFPSAH
jgi:amidase